MRSVICQGRTFTSMRELAEAHGLTPALVARRLRSGWTPEEAVGLSTRAALGTLNPVVAFGRAFRNMAEAARAYEVSPQLVADRVNKGYSLEDAIAGKLRGKQGARKPIVFEGQTYASREALCATFGQTWNNVQRRVKRGWTMRQALLLEKAPPRFRDFEGHARSHSWKVAKVEGSRLVPAAKAGGYKLYVIRHAASGKEYVGITTGDLQSRLDQHFAAARQGKKSALYNAMRRHGRDQFKISLVSDQARSYGELEELEIAEIARRDSIRRGYNTAQGGGLSTSKPITVNGSWFPGMAAAAAAHGVDPRVFAIRIGRLGWSPEEAAGLVDRSWTGKAKPVQLGGKSYPSLQAAAEALGVPYKTVHARLMRGWALERAFNK